MSDQSAHPDTTAADYGNADPSTETRAGVGRAGDLVAGAPTPDPTPDPIEPPEPMEPITPRDPEAPRPPA